jgi:subtilisin family serine protease
VLRAMMDAFEWGADVISMSLGSPYDTESPSTIPECRAIRLLTGAGIIVCVANGNDGDEVRTVGVPACEPSALSVGAVDMRGELAYFSSRGPTQEDGIKPDVVGPGVNITSSSTGLIALMQAGRDFVGTASISGTSMACPFIAGFVVLVKQLYRSNGVELTTSMFKDMMSKYGRKKDNLYGWGMPHWDYAKSYLASIRS